MKLFKILFLLISLNSFSQIVDVSDFRNSNLTDAEILQAAFDFANGCDVILEKDRLYTIDLKRF